MKAVKRISLTGLLLIILAFNSYATWSIIVIDPKTREIGIAGASCTYSVYGIGAIVPNKGAVIVQAMSNGDAREKGVEMIMAGAAPEKILAALRDPEFEPEEQQYAILCMNYLGNPVTYTGQSAPTHKGALTARGISVQGNTLSSPDELQAVLDAALKAQKKSLSIENILLLALEAGAKFGGDKRCGETKASSAFLTVVKPDDDIQKPFLNLVIYRTEDNVNAVEALRKKFDKWNAQLRK
jgi:uncharacterized Ntn-hydrolase superfamily protein